MSAPTDPTYPLLPLAGFVASALLLPVLLSSIARESWNLGVIFLCVSLIFQNFIFAINAVLWRNNADMKLFVYCEMSKRLNTYGSHTLLTHFVASFLRMATDIVKPMSTLIIMRRLYAIASLHSADISSQSAVPLPLFSFK